MRIIVGDSSCLIDLRKASLLDSFLQLPYEIVIPDTLFEEELLKFSATEKAALLENGLKVIELPGEGVRRAQELEAGFPELSIHDCFAFALAESITNSILLTGDGKLSDIAANHQIEVHGVLWGIDEMHKASTATALQLLQALELFESNTAIFRLPVCELKTFIRRYRSYL